MFLFGYNTNYYKVSILIFLTILTLSIDAQTSFSKDNFNFEVFVLPGGAQANQVQQIVQDKHGFLWFATKGGLIKYDGRTFRTFKHQPDNPNSLPINFVEKLFFDSNGMLWVGTYGKGLVQFNTELEEFSTPINLKEWITISNNTYVYAIEEDDYENLWIGTNGGLIKFNLDTQKSTYYDEDKDDINALRCNIIWNLYKDKSGTIWIGTGIPWFSDTNAGGLHRYNPETDDFTRFISNSQDNTSIGDNRVRALFEDSKNNFWVGTMGVGLYSMDREQGTFTRFGNQTNPKNALSRPYVVDENFQDKDFSQVTFVHEDQFGRLWIGAFNGGLNIYDPTSNAQIHFEVNEGLPTNYLFNILETNDNTIFLSTGDVGGNLLLKVNYSSNLFEKKNLPKKEKFNGYIQSILEDEEENIWLGTRNGEGLFKWDTEKDIIIPHPSILNTTNINSLGLDRSSRIWVGYHEKGMEVFYPDKLNLATIPLPKEIQTQITSESINTVFEDSKNNIWIPRRLNGVTILKKDNSILHLNKDNKGPNALSGTTIDRIKEDVSGNIWLFGNIRDYDGIYSLTIDAYNPTTNITKSYLLKGQESGFISSVDVDEAGNFWFTNSLDGIKKFNPQTGEITTLNTSNSRIPSDEVLALLVAKDGIVWMQTKKNIIAYHPDQNSFRIFNSLDGVDIELSHGSILERKNGDLIFGGGNDFLTLNPKKINWQKQFQKSFIKISDLKINNQSIATKSDLLSSVPVWNQKQLTFNHNQSNFSFALSCLDYHEESNYIEYFLENYDPYWRRVGPEQIAHYVNVPAGNYTFKTRGANHLGSWNTNGQSLTITVKAPWWKTWWAYLSYAFIGSVLVYFLYQFQLKRQIEQQEAQQLKEIDALKTKLYANITHEFRTPLTLILGQAQQIQKEETLDQSTNTKIKSIEKNGQQLLRLVNQLLDIRKLEAKEESPNMAQGDIVSVLSTFADSFESLALSRGIDYQIHLPHPPLKMDFDADKLQKIVANLISNAIKFTSKGGQVILFVQQLDNFLLINVKDSGIGIEEKELANIFNRFYRSDNSHQIVGTGIGLSLTKELVDLLKGQIQVNSQKGIGSEFTVKLPITNLAPKTEAFSPIPSTIIPEIIEPTSLPKTKNESDNLPLVLIVEDNADVAQFTAACLKDKYTIHFAENGQVGIDKAMDIIPDLIISDVMMPQKDGFQLCETLKQDEKTSHIPIVLLTARADIEDKIAGLSRGADAYLAKPFHESELNIRVEQLIQLREKLKERYAGLTLKKPSTDKALKLDDEFVLKVRAAIEENLDDEKFGVEELSKTIFLSRAQVHRKIKALTGKSTGQFMHTVRLHHALRFLQESDRSITAIAFDVGYNDPSYFTRMFTREFGQPPSYFVQKEV